jgi:sugar lactone lactonase YvrE
VYVNDDQTIYVAAYNNDRIIEWNRGATNGQVVAGGNQKGDQMNQLNSPVDVIVDNERNNLIICDGENRRVVRWSLQNGTKRETIISNIDCWRLTIDNDGYIYVADYKKHEVRRWKVGDINGILVAGGNGKGDNLNQLNLPTSIFVDEDHSVYVSDYNNHRVMKWMKDAKEGIIVAGGLGQGNGLAQLSYPQGLFVDYLGTVYVADSQNDRIMRWPKRAKEGTIVVGGNGQGKEANQLNNPMGLSFDRQGNLYVADCNNNRIQKFNINRYSDSND